MSAVIVLEDSDDLSYDEACRLRNTGGKASRSAARQRSCGRTSRRKIGPQVCKFAGRIDEGCTTLICPYREVLGESRVSPYGRIVIYSHIRDVTCDLQFGASDVVCDLDVCDVDFYMYL
eukprot:SAG22_NODE_204_length_15309_cov_12.747206_4_plen_119_part_00